MCSVMLLRKQSGRGTAAASGAGAAGVSDVVDADRPGRGTSWGSRATTRLSPGGHAPPRQPHYWWIAEGRHRGLPARGTFEIGPAGVRVLPGLYYRLPPPSGQVRPADDGGGMPSVVCWPGARRTVSRWTAGSMDSFHRHSDPAGHGSWVCRHLRRGRTPAAPTPTTCGNSPSTHGSWQVQEGRFLPRSCWMPWGRDRRELIPISRDPSMAPLGHLPHLRHFRPTAG